MDIDPYAVLGLPSDASLPQIKSAHRKLVLKCHPDKIKDDALRNDAQNEFQRVQHAYELLSDASRRTKYDQKVRLAELRRQMKEEQLQANAHASKAREYRNGRFYEERMPADAFDFDDEPMPAGTARKHDDWARRSREERKKSSKGRDASTSYSSRAKYRTKERRRETFEKRAPYVESEGSDSGASYVYVKRPEDEQPSPRKSKPTAAPPPPPPTEDKDDDYSDHYESKHEKLHTTARNYIRRSKGTAPVEIDSRHRPSRSPPHPHPRDYEPAAPGGTPRSERPSRESVRPSPSSRHGSYEHLDASSHPPPTSQPRASYEGIRIPSMPTASTTPPPKSSSAPRPSLQPSRSATTAAAYARSAAKRDPQVLENMISVDGTSRSSKVRGPDRYDSGYSSPGTPDMAHGTSPPKSSTRYKFVAEPATVLVEPDIPPPSSSRYPHGYSPPRPPHTPDRPPMSTRGSAKLTRSHTSYVPESSSSRYEKRPPPGSSSTRPLFGQVSSSSPRSSKEKDIKYAREYGPNGVMYSSHDPYHPRAYPYEDYRRRQSAYA